uniref:Uncharacterized protein n=1 Tax=Setaria italica TaxID=4555 RepID=K4ANF8_SETIT
MSNLRQESHEAWSYPYLRHGCMKLRLLVYVVAHAGTMRLAIMFAHRR